MQVKLNRGVNISEAYPAYIVDVIRKGDREGVAIVFSGKVNVGHRVVVRESGRTEVFLPSCL